MTCRETWANNMRGVGALLLMGCCGASGATSRRILALHGSGGSAGAFMARGMKPLRGAATASYKVILRGPMVTVNLPNPVMRSAHFLTGLAAGRLGIRRD